MPKVTEEHVEARRRQILAAAVECFARDGFHRATMQDIFKEAGLSPGAVYSYFDGKDAIVAAIGTQIAEMAERVFAPVLEADEAPPLADVIDTMIGEFEAGRITVGDAPARLIPQLWAESLRSPQLLEQVHVVLATARGNVAANVRRLQDAGRLDPELDSDAVARTVIALFHGFILQRGWYPDMDVDAFRAAARALVGDPSS